MTATGNRKIPIYRKELKDGRKVTGPKPLTPAGRKRINSRRKGAVGERAFARLLQDYGLTAYRGQQFCGRAGNADVECPDLPNVHFEVKNCVASLVMYEWIEQAARDAKPGKLRVVAHRAKHHDWLAIMPIEDFLKLVLRV